MYVKNKHHVEIETDDEEEEEKNNKLKLIYIIYNNGKNTRYQTYQIKRIQC